MGVRRGNSPNNSASNGGGWISKKKRHVIYARDNYRCVFCGEHVIPSERTLEHLKSQEHGGTHSHKNLMLACNFCNAQKGKKSLRSYYKWLENKGIDPSRIKQRIKNRKRRKLSLQ